MQYRKLLLLVISSALSISTAYANTSTISISKIGAELRAKNLVKVMPQTERQMDKRHKVELRVTAVLHYALGEEYYLGNTVPQNYVKANYWFSKSAKLGFAPADYQLANDYYWGLGVTRNIQKSKDFLVKAVNSI